MPTTAVPKDFRFDAVDTGDGYLIDTDLNYTALNAVYHQRVPPTHSSLSDAYILAHVLTARSQSFFACDYMAEIVTSSTYSDIMRIRHFDVLLARGKSIDQLTLFQDVVLSNMPSVRDVMNSGERSLADFMKLLDASEKFRKFLHCANPDKGVLTKYVEEMRKTTWADSLPTKSVRFVLATGAGLALDLLAPTGLGTAAGAAVGAADTFFLDRLIKGWKPNQFIEGPYRQFVDTKSTRE